MPEAAAAATSMPEWQLILLTALVTTVGTAIVSYFGHLWTVRSDSKAERERHARYLAIRVITSLDTFVNECGDVVYDDGLSDHEGVTHPREATPTLTLPEDVDWRSVDPDFMYRCLGLPNEIASHDKAISWVVDQIAGPPDYEEFFTERKLRYGQLGLRALKLADDLRVRYKVPARDTEGWNPKDTLEGKVKEAEKEKADEADRQARMFKEMQERSAAAKAAEAAAAEPPKAT